MHSETIDLFSTIDRTGKIPSDRLKSTFVTMPKKANASKCDGYPVISLMFHVLKTFLRAIKTRIVKKFEQQVYYIQFGFRNGLVPGKAHISLNVLTNERNICLFHRLPTTSLLTVITEILRAIEMVESHLRFITELYWDHKAQIKVDNCISEEISLRN